MRIQLYYIRKLTLQNETTLIPTTLCFWKETEKSERYDGCEM